MSGTMGRAVNVYATNGTVDNPSRHEMVAWVNKLLEAKFTKVEELCTGAAYCQFMDMMFPNSVPMNRIKFRTNTEYDSLQNFKLLQVAFKNVAVAKEIPVERLVKGRFQDNLEFLQWFCKFVETNYDGHVYHASKARNGQILGYGPNFVRPKDRILSPLRVDDTLETPRTAKRPRQEDQRPVPEYFGKNDHREGIEKDRDMAFSKLRDIEILCQGDFRRCSAKAVAAKVLKIVNALHKPKARYTGPR